MARSLRAGAAVLTLGTVPFFQGCGFTSGLDWADQVQPAGPCYDANLLDGLDTSSTAEEHAVFACLNASQALSSFAGLDASLDAPTRDGLVGVVLAQWVQSAAEADGANGGDVLSGLVAAGAAVIDDPAVLTDRLPVLFELAYGAPWSWIGSTVDPARDEMTAGLLLPGLDLAGRVATPMLDDEAWVEPAVAALRSERTVSALWSLASLPTAPDSTLRSLGEEWPDRVSELVAASEDASNDRWSGASGNSLRDLAAAMVSEDVADPAHRMVVDAVLSAAAPIVQDTDTGAAVAAMLREQASYGRLAVLPSQLKWLASVDVHGGTLDGGEDSALTSLLRLLSRGDQSVDCTVDLGLFDVDFSLGNLSVSLLDTLEQQDPDTVESGVGLLGGLLGVSLTDSVLNGVADSGVCPVIDAQLVQDLHAVDRLADPEADALLRVLLAGLTATAAHTDSLVATVHTVWDSGATPAVEESLRDLGDTAVAVTMMDCVGALVDPAQHYDAADFPDGVAPFDFTMVWDLLADASDTSLQGLRGPLAAGVAADATWTMVHNASTLLRSPDARVRDVLADLQPLLRADPELPWLTALADGVADAPTRRRVAVLVENEPLRRALAQPAVGPVPQLAVWTLDGSLDVLVHTLQILSSLLPESS